MQTLFIAVGGAAGALLRYWMSNGMYILLGRGFPYGTLTVNIVGDGSVMFHTRGKHFDADASVVALGDSSLEIAGMMDFDDVSTVGAPIRDSISGAWVVPGEFGIRVNE